MPISTGLFRGIGFREEQERLRADEARKADLFAFQKSMGFVDPTAKYRTDLAYGLTESPVVTEALAGQRGTRERADAAERRAAINFERFKGLSPDSFLGADFAHPELGRSRTVGSKLATERERRAGLRQARQHAEDLEEYRGQIRDLVIRGEGLSPKERLDAGLALAGTDTTSPRATAEIAGIKARTDAQERETEQARDHWEMVRSNVKEMSDLGLKTEQERYKQLRAAGTLTAAEAARAGRASQAYNNVLMRVFSLMEKGNVQLSDLQAYVVQEIAGLGQYGVSPEELATMAAGVMALVQQLATPGVEWRTIKHKTVDGASYEVDYDPNTLQAHWFEPGRVTDEGVPLLGGIKVGNARFDRQGNFLGVVEHQGQQVDTAKVDEYVSQVPTAEDVRGLLTDPRTSLAGRVLPGLSLPEDSSIASMLRAIRGGP